MTIEINELPDSCFVRLPELVGRRPVPPKNGKPGRPGERGVLRISAATLWRKVAAGRFPKQVKISDGLVAWRAGEVKEWMKDPDNWKPRDSSTA